MTLLNVEHKELLDMLFNTELKKWILHPTLLQYWCKAFIQWIILCISTYINYSDFLGN